MSKKSSVRNDSNPPADLISAVESLMRASGIGVRRESDRQSYRQALDMVLQAARSTDRRDLFDTSLHVAHNLEILCDRPAARANALLPLLDFPIALHDCVWHATDDASPELLLACLADPQWPAPLDDEGVYRLRALFTRASDAARHPAMSAAERAAREARDSAFNDLAPGPDAGPAPHDSDRLWSGRAGPILKLSATAPAPRLECNRETTEREQAQARRSELEAQLRQAQKMEAITTLAGGIANDFNNILGAILGNLALACDELGEHPTVLHSLEQVNSAARRATKLVREILTFSRLEPNHLVNRPLQPLLQESVESLRATLPAGVTLEAQLADAPLHMLADGAKIRQVMSNLFTNAVQALRGGPGRVAVGLEKIEFLDDSPRRPATLVPGEYAHVWVSDSGCGMDLHTRGRIFEPFFTTRPKGRGAGMGLSVVHGIVATHQGAISVDSTPEKGSTFHVFFPLARAQDSASESSPRMALPAQAQGNGQHVLYLDDDEMMLMLAQALLRRQGHRVTCYQDPHLALAAVRADPHAFDLVVTDVNMSDLSGFEVARELARIRPDLPVAVSSGDLGEQRRTELERCGVRGLIHKESMFAELGPMVDRLLMNVATAPGA